VNAGNQNRTTIMRGSTEKTPAIHPLTDTELNEASGGSVSFGYLIDGIGVTIGDQRGHIMNGIAKAALGAVLGR
jgi:hypothetical protein